MTGRLFRSGVLSAHTIESVQAETLHYTAIACLISLPIPVCLFICFCVCLFFKRLGIMLHVILYAGEGQFLNDVNYSLYQ